MDREERPPRRPPATYARSAWLFRRLLGLVYLCSFWSFAVQLPGLIGSGGILPAADYMTAVRSWAAAGGVGLGRFHLFPTLFWISSSDAFLSAVCWGGVAASALLLAGVLPLVAAIASWVGWLSLVVVGQDFLRYQWDALLAEAGFLTLFLTPASWLDRPREADAPPRLGVWLMWWLLFRLNLASGAVKLTSGDATWRNLTALTVHFETQPIPTPAAWYAHHLPHWFLVASCAGVLALELLAPLLILGPRRLRMAAVAPLVGLQAAIALTGNYASFNLLTAALAVLLFDDAALGRLWKRVLPSSGHGSSRSVRFRGVRLAVTVVAAVATAPPAFLALSSALGIRPPGWQAMALVGEIVSPLHVANPYGLFAVMTTTRPEIIVQGSEDGVNWREYEFKYKPGELARRPPWVAPHQPRLDWQMWFAALGRFEGEFWIRQFFNRLLEGSPDVLALLGHDPFDGRPPRYLRAELMRYRFTDGGPAWWRTERLGEYAPVLSLAREP